MPNNAEPFNLLPVVVLHPPSVIRRSPHCEPAEGLNAGLRWMAVRSNGASPPIHRDSRLTFPQYVDASSLISCPRL